MSPIRSRWVVPFSTTTTLSLVAACALFTACGGDNGPSGSGVIVPGDGPFEVDNGFESDDPSGRNQGNRAGGGADAGAAASPPESGGDNSGGNAQRAIEEADIIKVDGTRLYALSRYGGLSIIDVTDPAHMRLLGRKRIEGMPFEMYVRAGRAYVMLSDFGRWISPAADGYGQWIQTSEILAFNVDNPQSISEVAHYDVPGTIADSRLVGDALYLVTYENGYCYGCSERPSTTVTSFNIANSAISRTDALAFTSPNQNYSSWQRSVSATNQRLYIAGPEWSWSGSGQANSVIQVVDITDPTGVLHKGADVPVSGQINSRWQMDEFNGVLRVVSQNGNSWGNNSANPAVQTFTINNSNSFTALGQTELQLPHPELLQSVRFDGARGYAITSQRSDPLFTIDLADPAHPRQAGELVMPGWIFHMEPRGNRLIGFGYDDTNWSNAHLSVSLFDVSNIAQPTMLKRVSFGNTWGQVAEDQDRIHKSVSVLEDLGLILVPYASYGYWDNGSCNKPDSGIQLIDYSGNDLTLRGVAPQYGMPRRALVTNGRLLAVSDRNVTSFDISSRSNPRKLGELDLSNPAYRLAEVGNHIASITTDWWTSEALLSLTPKANADDANTVGKLSLASLVDQDPSSCAGRYNWTSWYSARLFTNGSILYLAVPTYSYNYEGNGQSSSTLIVASIDVSNPAAPRILGKRTINLGSNDSWGWYGGFYDDYAYYSYGNSLVGSGQGIVQYGAKLAYLAVQYEPITTYENGQQRYSQKIHRNLHVVDFANPSDPAVATPINLGDSLGSSPLHVYNGTVLTSRYIQSTVHPDKVRFFVDRVDLTGASPIRIPSINTPGSLLMADEPSHRFVTTDYTVRREPARDWQECYQRPENGIFDYDSSTCIIVTRFFKVVDVNQNRVSLRQTVTPPAQNLAGIQIADDRIYVTHYPRYAYGYGGAPVADGNNSTQAQPDRLEDGGLWVFGGIRDGNLRIVSQMAGDARWPLAANGTKVALYTDGGLAIYDTNASTPTLLSEANLRGWGYTSHVLLNNDRAICSLGEWGLQTIRF